MLLLQDLEGTDLVAQPPDNRLFASTGVGAVVPVVVTFIETGLLPQRTIEAFIDWNDGTPVETFTANGTLAISVQRRLAPGDYSILVAASNFKAPTPETAQARFRVQVKDSRPVLSPTVPLLFGPILPRDMGSPNADTWSFNSATDLLILESSVKMLVSTSVGERLMEPEYGTRIRALIFEQSTQNIEALAEQEISEALARWEPRVSLQTISVVRRNDRSVSINMTLVSRLQQQVFESVLTFAPA